MIRHLLNLSALAIAGSLVTSAPAAAHPHVWVTMTTEVVYAPDGSVKAVRHAWAFDDMFSVFATQGLDMKVKDKPSREELQPLAQTNVESLKDFDYFTAAKANGQEVAFDPPLGDYYAEYKDSVLTLYFTLPFKQPVKAKELELQIYDSSFFVDFSFADKNPASLAGAPATCKLSIKKPGEMDPNIAAKLGALGPDAQVDPSLMLSNEYASKIVVACP